MSLRLRVIIGMNLIFLMALGLMLNTIRNEARPRYKEVVEESLVDLANVFASTLSNEVKTSEFNTRRIEETTARIMETLRSRTIEARIFDVEKNKFHLNVYVTDSQGVVLYDSASPENIGKDFSRWNDVARTLQGRYGARSTRSNPDEKLSSVLYVAAPILIEGRLVGTVSVSKPEMAVEAFFKRTVNRIFLAGLITSGVVLLLSILFSLFVTRPIRQLTEYAQRNRGEGRFPLPPISIPEFRRLGEAFEETRIALEGRKAIESYVQALTHEIKSPLTAIQGAAELMNEEMPRDDRSRFLSNIRTESDRIRNIVDALLDLAALESRQTLEATEWLVLSEIVQEVIASLDPLIKSKRLNLVYRGFEVSPRVKGERFLMTQSIRNLIQNSIDFSPIEGTIVIELRQTDEAIELSINDEGPGIPEFALPRIFERFYSLQRPLTGKKSSGIGLSFVKEAMALHNASVYIANRPNVPGRSGAVATLRFPLGSSQ